MADERAGGLVEQPGDAAGARGAATTGGTMEASGTAADGRAGAEAPEVEVAALRQAVAARTTERDQAQQALVAAHRRALLAEHRGGLVEALVAGDTVEALDASVARARAAYAEVAAQLQAETAGAVPAGNPARAQPSYEALSPQAKIAAALRRGT